VLKNRRTWAIAVLAALVMVFVVVAAVQAAMLRSRGWGVPIGSVAEWVAAVGGLATVGALLVAWRVYRHDVDSRREDIRHQYVTDRRQQAENITAWPGGHTAVEREVIHGQGPVVTSAVQVNILNASPSVVYDVIVVTANRHSGHPGVISAPDMHNIKFEEFDWLPVAIAWPVAAHRSYRPAPGGCR
jgi:hypothetical protein